MRGALTVLLVLAAAARARGGGVLQQQTAEEVTRKGAGCVTCHTQTDSPSMHETSTVRLGCIDCHGGDATAGARSGRARPSADNSAAATGDTMSSDGSP